MNLICFKFVKTLTRATESRGSTNRLILTLRSTKITKWQIRKVEKTGFMTS